VAEYHSDMPVNYCSAEKLL